MILTMIEKIVMIALIKIMVIKEIKA